jgi:hypothetical protein
MHWSKDVIEIVLLALSHCLLVDFRVLGGLYSAEGDIDPLVISHIWGLSVRCTVCEEVNQVLARGRVVHFIVPDRCGLAPSGAGFEGEEREG